MSRGGQPAAADLRRRRRHQLAIVGEAGGDARRPARHHRHEVAVVQQVLRQVFDDPLDVRRVLGLDVHVVDEDRRRRGRPRSRTARRAFGSTMPSGAAATSGAASPVKVRPPCTSANEVMVCAHAVFEHREVVLGQVGDEAAVAVAGDDVGRHGRDGRPERRLPPGPAAAPAGAATPSAAKRQQAGRQRHARSETAWPCARLYGRVWNTERRGTRASAAAPRPSRRRFLRRALTLGGLAPRAARRAGWPGSRPRRRATTAPAGELVRDAAPLRRRRRETCPLGADARRSRASTRGCSPISSRLSPGRAGHAVRRGVRAHGGAAGPRPRRRPAGPSRCGAASAADGVTVTAAALAGDGPPDGRPPHRVRRQLQPAELRPDERGRVGRRAAGARCSTALPRPPGATGRARHRRRSRHRTGSRQSLPGASWVLPLDALDRAGAVPRHAA